MRTQVGLTIRGSRFSTAGEGIAVPFDQKLRIRKRKKRKGKGNYFWGAAGGRRARATLQGEKRKATNEVFHEKKKKTLGKLAY